jgi:hypothetical protein
MFLIKTYKKMGGGGEETETAEQFYIARNSQNWFKRNLKNIGKTFLFLLKNISPRPTIF